MSGYQIVSQHFLHSGGAGTAGTFTVPCPTGTRVLSGGYDNLDVNGNETEDSYPAAGGSGWTVTVVDTALDGQSVFVFVWAVCATVS